MVVLLPTHAIENDKLENPLEATRRSTRYHAYRRKVYSIHCPVQITNKNPSRALALRASPTLRSFYTRLKK